MKKVILYMPPHPVPPTMAELQDGIDLTAYITGAEFTPRRHPVNHRCYQPAKPKRQTPPPWAGNIAQQKRRRRL